MDISTDMFNSFAQALIQRFRELPVVSASHPQPIKVSHQARNIKLSSTSELAIFVGVFEIRTRLAVTFDSLHPTIRHRRQLSARGASCIGESRFESFRRVVLAAGVGRQLADGGIVLYLDSKILFITGYAGNAVLGDGNLTRGMQLVTKSLAMDELARLVRTFVVADYAPATSPHIEAEELPYNIAGFG